MRIRFHNPRQWMLNLLIIGSLLYSGCGSQKSLPIEKIKNQLASQTTYSILLDDMKTEGNFVKTYFHKYKIVKEDGGFDTHFMEVPKNYYNAHKDHVGMTLFAKKDGKEIESVAPPGYAYVGDERYGEWRRDQSGHSFWAFYGQYAFISHMMGGWYRPIYRDDFDGYKRYRKKGKTYFGRRNQYGTKGSIVKTTKPSFYKRRMAVNAAKKLSFSDKVARKIGRTRTSFRSRSGGIGK